MYIYAYQHCIITDISVLVSGHRGPCSKYNIDITEGNFKGELEVKWGGEPLKVGITVHSQSANC